VFVWRSASLEGDRRSVSGKRSLARQRDAGSSRRPSVASQLTAPSQNSRYRAPRSPSAWSYRNEQRRGSEWSEQSSVVGDDTLTPGKLRQVSGESGIRLPPIPPIPRDAHRDTEDAGATPSMKSRKKSLIKRPSLNFRGFGSRSNRSQSRPNSP